MALKAAATLGAAGYPTQGLCLLDRYEHVQDKIMPPNFGMPILHNWVMARQNYWPQELATLRHQLNLDAKANCINTAPTCPDQSTTR